MDNNQQTRKCPFCAEEIKTEAIKCKHCGSNVSDNVLQGSVAEQAIGKQTSSAQVMLEYEGRKKSGLVAALLNLVIPGAGYVYCERHILGIFVFVCFVLLPLYFFGLTVSGLFLSVFWLVFVIDGFLCAGRYNRELALQIATREPQSEPVTKEPNAPSGEPSSNVADTVSTPITDVASRDFMNIVGRTFWD